MAPTAEHYNSNGLDSAKNSNIVLFDVTKNELYKVSHFDFNLTLFLKVKLTLRYFFKLIFQINDTLKNLQRKLKGNWKTQTNGSGTFRDEGQSTIALESLMQVKIFIISLNL